MFNFNWLNGVSVAWGKFFTLLAFIAPMIFALTMKKRYIYQGAPDGARWRNLKIWVLAIVVIQVAIYLYF
ncbi:hypothetical protein JXA02_04570 [candidate division KSB1 bacterium]|nr:hypothetical protein [candidate division KSB1 bacterium]RQW08777.1 MAG: hypothetical protein EH222_05190 [candidate division KSB1 bacterium]